MLERIAEGVLRGDIRSIARAISIVENNESEAEKLINILYPHTKGAYIIGLTGSPGVGKSTLADKLIAEFRKVGYNLAVLAVDPSSPFTGGAFLGDRLRMQSHALDKGVFIRSMGTRGSLGGLSPGISDAIKVLDAGGKELLLVETVGVGQAEVDIVGTADTVVLVLVPGLGDDIQVNKAGIMEIADIFVVNKADREGVNRVVTEVKMMLDLAYSQSGNGWIPPVIRTIAEKGDGVEDLVDAIKEHRYYLEESGVLQERRNKRIKWELENTLQHKISRYLEENVLEDVELIYLEKIMRKEMSNYAVADEILNTILRKKEGVTDEC